VASPESNAEGNRKHDRGSPPGSTGTAVRFTASAKKNYLDIVAQAEKARLEGKDPSDESRRAGSLLRRAVEHHIPGDPANKRFALPPPFDGLFRARHGCVCICWYVIGQPPEVIVVSIATGPRHEVDPMHILQRLQQAGFDYATVFAEWEHYTDPGPNASVN